MIKLMCFPYFYFHLFLPHCICYVLSLTLILSLLSILLNVLFKCGSLAEITYRDDNFQLYSSISCYINWVMTACNFTVKLMQWTSMFYYGYQHHRTCAKFGFEIYFYFLKVCLWPIKAQGLTTHAGPCRQIAVPCCVK